MTNAVHKDDKVVPFPSPSGATPALLPGIEGFYVLTADGRLGRYSSDGRFSENPDLTESLAAKLEVLLKRYRAGDVDDLALALVTRSTPDQSWRSASLAFSDKALHEVFRTSNDPSAPLTTFQRRNRIKSVYQGMELVLETKEASQPPKPRFCPVLFSPEADGETLRRRYGVAATDARIAFEVLDLMAPLSAVERKDPALTRMVVEMSQGKIAPELRSLPELMVVENPVAEGRNSTAESASQYNLWEDEPEQRQTCFNDGDPVTYWLLAWFSPFNELNDLQRQFLARGHVVTRRRAGARLVERGSREDVTIYLIEGTLELEAFDGRKMSIVGGTRRAHLPISQLRPHAYTV
ncbi:MAG: hypothetical protein WB783_19565, partial [Arenicellales bacterium]